MNKTKNRNKYLAGILSENVEINSEGKVECEKCNGEGEGMFSCCTGDKINSDWARCPQCLENLAEKECEDCEGLGFIDSH
tara:strand:- start:49 stop:288 length:240 start_codon:yes stop_codon:yes gene_type:complete